MQQAEPYQAPYDREDLRQAWAAGANWAIRSRIENLEARLGKFEGSSIPDLLDENERLRDEVGTLKAKITDLGWQADYQRRSVAQAIGMDMGYQ